MPVRPIDRAARDIVIAATQDWVARARLLYDRQFVPVPVRFDLVGRAAGMYRVDRRGRVVRFNPFLFAKFFEDTLAVTVPHEVAHYVVDMLYAPRRVRPHGAEWQAVMRDFQVDPRRTVEFDLEGVPQRRQRRFAYRCRCRDHSLSTRAHNRLRESGVRYLCRGCGEPLRPVPQCAG